MTTDDWSSTEPSPCCTVALLLAPMVSVEKLPFIGMAICGFLSGPPLCDSLTGLPTSLVTRDVEGMKVYALNLEKSDSEGF